MHTGLISYQFASDLNYLKSTVNGSVLEVVELKKQNRMENLYFRAMFQDHPPLSPPQHREGHSAVTVSTKRTFLNGMAELPSSLVTISI